MTGIDVKNMQDNLNEEQGQQNPADNGGEGDTRSTKRIKDLADKVSTIAQERDEQAKKHEAEKAQLLKEKQDLEFRLGFSEVGSKYPNAKEFEADIRAKVTSGYTLEDATVSVLASKGALSVPNQRQEASSFAGGSADTPIREVQKNDPNFGGDIGKMREELVRLEDKGDIGLRR